MTIPLHGNDVKISFLNLGKEKMTEPWQIMQMYLFIKEEHIFFILLIRKYPLNSDMIWNLNGNIGIDAVPYKLQN